MFKIIEGDFIWFRVCAFHKYTNISSTYFIPPVHAYGTEYFKRALIGTVRYME